MPKRTRNASVSRSVRRRLFNGSAYSGGMRSGARVEGGNRKVTIRCRITAASGTADFTVAGLCCAAGCVATSATQAYSMSRSIKLLKASVKSISPSHGIVEEISLEFGGSTSFDSNRTYVNSTNTEGKSAYITARPDRGSAAAGWMDTSASSVVQVTGSAGTIVELTFLIGQVKQDVQGYSYPWVVAGMIPGTTQYLSASQHSITI